MVKCSFRIPVEAWRFKDDVFGYMTMINYLNSRGKYCSVFQDFMEDIKMKLNGISSTKSLWDVKLCDADDSLYIIFYTDNEDITLTDFYNIVDSTILSIFNTIKSSGEILVFRKHFFDKYSIKLEFTDIDFRKLC